MHDAAVVPGDALAKFVPGFLGQRFAAVRFDLRVEDQRLPEALHPREFDFGFHHD